jgi:hypothetical protein
MESAVRQVIRPLGEKREGDGMSSNERTHIRCVVVVLLLLIGSADALAQTDWDLYALRLTNRARQNPAAEAAIIGSSVVDDREPVGPLALHRLVSQAAENHVDWMHDNFGSIPSGIVPDTFTSYETLTGRFDGEPATNSPSYTAVWTYERLEYVGFEAGDLRGVLDTDWAVGSAGVTKTQVEEHHLAKWENGLERAGLLRGGLTVFGQSEEWREFTPPLGGLPTPYSFVYFREEHFTQPWFDDPQFFLFGVLFVDLDATGDWTPRYSDDPLREGLASIGCTVFVAGTQAIVTTDTTMNNGAFSLNVDPGVYDIEIQLADRALLFEDIEVVDQNVEIGDVEVLGEGALLTACLHGPDISPIPNRLGYTMQHCIEAFDDDDDADVDLHDYAAYARTVGRAIPWGDFDGDGDVDDNDLLLLADCLHGPGQPVSPTLPGLSPPSCLSTFDADNDEDVDLRDYAVITLRSPI